MFYIKYCHRFYVFCASMHDEKCLNSRKAWTGIETLDKIKHKKEYYDDNKDKVREYNKEHHTINKNKIKQRINIEVTCTCGKNHIGLNNKLRHEKTKRHQSWLKGNI